MEKWEETWKNKNFTCYNTLFSLLIVAEWCCGKIHSLDINQYIGRSGKISLKSKTNIL